MKNILNTVLIFVLISVLSLGLVSCSNDYAEENPIGEDLSLNNSIESNLTESENKGTDQESSALISDYSLIEQSGKNYIVFDSISMYQNNGQSQLANLEFSNMKTFKDSVVNGKLADWQKTTIATSFKKDDFGVLTCDFNNLLEPRLPDNFKIDGISWSGETYSFYISASSDVFGFVHNYSSTQYYEIFEDEFENYFNKETITVKENTETDDGKVVTTYSTSAGDLLQIRYTIVDGNKTIVVDETYRIDMADESIQTSSTIPTNVTLYCVDKGAYYIVDLFGFTIKPTEQWLCEFDMQTYVDVEVVAE